MSADRGQGYEGAETERTRLERNGLDDSALTLRVVEYPDAADRCTVYPPDLGEHERMSHWLSADRDAFVSLELRR